MKILVNRSAILTNCVACMAIQLPAQTRTAIQTVSEWQSCTACAWIGAGGSAAAYSMTQELKPPSLSGHSARFSIGVGSMNIFSFTTLDGLTHTVNRSSFGRHR